MSIFHDQASLMQRARQQLHEKAVNPYAVGMAAAMEQEDDKPPLKKSTITKAHKIAKKVEKAGYEPEGDQLSEKEDSPYEKASDAALDKRYGYGRASGGKRSFGRAANRSSAAAALRAIRRGERSGSGTSTEAGADAVHRGWAHTARTSEDQTPEKKARRAKLANTDYKDLPDDEKEKDRVSFNAVKAVHKARKNNLSSSYEPEGEMVDERIRLSYVPPGNPNYERDDEGNVKLSRENLKKKAGKTLRTLIGGGKDRGSIRIRFGEETQIDEIAPLVAAGLLAAPVVAGVAAGHFMKKAVEKGQQNPNRRLVTGGTVGDLQRARSESIEITNQMIDEGKADKKLPEHEERRGVKKEEVISHLIDNGFAETEQNALKIMENMGESWAQEIITELNRLEREQGKESGGNPDKAYQHVKKMIRGMEGKPAGQRKKVPGKKPPAAGEYGGPHSPAQKVAMRRAAKKRSDEMQSSTYD